MRIATPDLTQENQIHQAGTGVINLFATDLFEYLNNVLVGIEGVNWLTQYRKSNLVYQNYNFVDPSNLLKELLRTSSSPLRKPLRKEIPQAEILPFFDRLQVLLDDRNEWVHQNSNFTKAKLKTILLNMYPIIERLNLPLKSECDYLLLLLDGIAPDVPQSVSPIVAASGSRSEFELSRIIGEVISDDDISISTPVDLRFLSYSYVLHLTGEIRNRSDNLLLSECNPENAEKIGALLIARKPEGGRLKIASDGTLAAYFDDHWGYLARVNSAIWFPSHLPFSI